MPTQGILYKDIKYIRIIKDLNKNKMRSLEDFIYCILVDISMNVNDKIYASEADNYLEQLKKSIKFQKDNNLKYAHILGDTLFISEFNEWLGRIRKSLFNFELIPAYDTLIDISLDRTIDLDDYIRFDDIWILEIINLREAFHSPFIVTRPFIG